MDIIYIHSHPVLRTIDYKINFSNAIFSPKKTLRNVARQIN